ncbi:NUDIX hydrolase [bacterium]|nr:NUDIX hydrolase [bacterium]
MNGRFCYDYPRPMVTVDAVVLSVFDDEPAVLLIKRLNEPYKDLWALPGGFIKMEENLKNSALRELKEETGLEPDKIYQAFTVGTPHRDPRGRTISVVYTAFMPANCQPEQGDDAKEAKWFSLLELPQLAFDHQKILKKVLQKWAEPVSLKNLIKNAGLLLKFEPVFKKFLGN